MPPDGPSSSDAQLVSRALAGRREAFNQLVLRHEGRLFRFLCRACPNAADVEDAMQHAFVKAYRKLATYNPRYAFTTWLFTIAVRELRALRRRRPAVATTPLHDAPEPPARPELDADPGDLWSTARRLLSDVQYTALWLRHGEDLPVRDVARVMRRPRVWVSVTLHRACATLRAAVGRPAGSDRRPMAAEIRPVENAQGGLR